LIRPSNVFGLEVGDVALRPAKMPARFVEVAPLRVLLPVHDQLEFLERDGPFGLEFDFRPETLRNERPVRVETPESVSARQALAM